MSAPCGNSNNTISVTAGDARNDYPIEAIRWEAFLHPPTGLGMLVDLRSGDRPWESDETGHLWDDGGRGCQVGGSWVAA